MLLAVGFEQPLVRVRRLAVAPVDDHSAGDVGVVLEPFPDVRAPRQHGLAGRPGSLDGGADEAATDTAAEGLGHLGVHEDESLPFTR